MRHPELLIPASSLEVLKIAVIFGADAVYIGGEAFGLRAKAKNFSLEEMKEGVAFAHAHNVRVYVTANILAHNSDLDGVRKYFEELKEVVVSLHEFNPMMGHRGCRLDVTYPEIGVMQTKAIIGAAINVKKEGIDVKPEIMIPLVGDYKELVYVKNIITETANEMLTQENMDIKYMVGTMIELPRATLIADKIAKEAEFFSFGTNDLTQMTFGFSRDDAGKFLNEYYSKNIYDFDPFARIDEEGVGKLVEHAIKLGKQTRPDIELGICGEHGGNPPTVEYCHRIGLTYVSCSPFRVPIARLAAAQAAIKYPR